MCRPGPLLPQPLGTACPQVVKADTLPQPGRQTRALQIKERDRQREGRRGACREMSARENASAGRRGQYDGSSRHARAMSAIGERRHAHI
jgi:hypothetical protein